MPPWILFQNTFAKRVLLLYTERRCRGEARCATFSQLGPIYIVTGARWRRWQWRRSLCCCSNTHTQSDSRRARSLALINFTPNQFHYTLQSKTVTESLLATSLFRPRCGVFLSYIQRNNCDRNDLTHN